MLAAVEAVIEHAHTGPPKPPILGEISIKSGVVVPHGQTLLVEWEATSPPPTPATIPPCLGNKKALLYNFAFVCCHRRRRFLEAQFPKECAALRCASTFGSCGGDCRNSQSFPLSYRRSKFLASPQNVIRFCLNVIKLLKSKLYPYRYRIYTEFKCFN